jgi:hypothetical protein
MSDFTIRNDSNHKLPKVIILKKVSTDDAFFKQVEDMEAMKPGEYKSVSIGFRLPTVARKQVLRFQYFNINGKLLGDEIHISVCVDLNLSH